MQATVTADVAELGVTTGGVEFYDQVGSGDTAEMIDLGPGTLVSVGVFTLRTPPLESGSHNFTAVYSGDGFYQPSTSAAATVSIGDAAYTLSIGGPYVRDCRGPECDLTLPNDPYGNEITQWAINWGDGTRLPCSRPLSIRPTAPPGTYTINARRL